MPGNPMDVCASMRSTQVEIAPYAAVNNLLHPAVSIILFFLILNKYFFTQA